MIRLVPRCFVAALASFAAMVAIAQSPPPPAPQVAAGDFHTLLLKTDRTVWAWGRNDAGQLGDGTHFDRASPVQVAISDVVQVSAKTSASYAVKQDGSLWAWGRNDSGELGDGTNVSRASPVRVAGLATVVGVAAGDGYALALLADGSLWAWGANSFGQLGDGTTTDRRQPVRVSGLTNVAAMSAGPLHALAARSDGTVWSWGANMNGQLGDGTHEQRLSPVQVKGLPSAVVASRYAVAAGNSTSLAVTADGRVFAWGQSPRRMGEFALPGQISGLPAVQGVLCNWSSVLTVGAVSYGWGHSGAGQLGDGSGGDYIQATPSPVSSLGTIAAVAAGHYHGAAVTSDGAVWAWGDNSSGQLGDGTLAAHDRPARVLAAGASGFLDATSAAGSANRAPDASFTASPSSAVAPATIQLDASASSDADGTIASYQWSVSNGASASGKTAAVAAPDGSDYAITLKIVDDKGAAAYATRTVRVESAANLGRVAPTQRVAMSDGNAFALSADGSLFGSGATPFLGSSAYWLLSLQTYPSRIPSVKGGVAVQTSTGSATCLVKADGSLWCWGNNDFGMVGDGTTITRTVPTRIALANVVAVAMDDSASYALKSDGTVWSWGLNDQGQLGDGTFADHRTPQQVPGLGGVRSISANQDRVLAAKADGTVWAWGAQFIDGTGASPSAKSPSPRQVANISDVRSVGGGDTAMAVKNDGTVWLWGGSGDKPSASWILVPTRVQGLSNIVKATARRDNLGALASDGTLYVWGDNASGQIGNGSLTASASPVAVPTLANVVDFDLIRTVIAVDRNGVAYAWGDNFAGQVGDGTFATRLRPVVVRNENASGTIAGNDWFLDLDPAASKTIPPDKVPAFLATASGSVRTSFVKVDANVRFRAQDVGKSYAVFAYAPSSLVKSARAAKDGPACALSQLGPAGLQGASGPTLSFLGNVAGTQSQAVSILNDFAAAGIAGSTFCLGVGQTGAEALSAANVQCVATVPGSTVCAAPDAPPASVPADIPGALSGLWWNAGESGWGVAFTQRRDVIFAAWYTYDAAGNPKWYVASRCAMATANATSGTCTGDLYEVNGPTFFGAPFNPAAVQVTTAGSLQVSFQNASSASMTYTVGTQTRTVAITRQPIASGTAPPAIDYTDLWYNPAESGWGMAIAQQFNVMFLAWYVYDAGGKPVWYVASNCAVNSSGNGCSGTLYRTTGPPLGPTFDASHVQVFEAGTVTASFGDANNGTISYTVGAVTSSKAITRELF